MMRAMTDVTDPPVARTRERALTPGDPRIGPWRAFITAHALVTRRLDDDLRTEQGMTLAEYGALLHIAEAPARRLRMNQLADSILLSRSGVTRLIDRLEADGLVERSHCASDGRGAEAVLTEAGIARLRAASRTHLRGIETYFLSPIDSSDLATMADGFRKINDHARDDGRATACETVAVDAVEPRRG